MMATIQDVAKLAGVSVATAYKVFDPSYKTDTLSEEKVLSAAKKLGFIPKKKKKNRQFSLIALIFSEADNPFNESLIATLSKHFTNKQYRVIVLFSNENETTERENLKLVYELDVDAVVFATVSGNQSPEFEQLIEKGIPIVQIFIQIDKRLNAIVVDDVYGTYLATKSLINAGHRDILMVYRWHSEMPEREPGYYRAFYEAKCDVNEEYLLRLDFDLNIKSILKEKIKTLKPTAIIAVNEAISLGTVQALQELDYSIPKDISLVVYDDLPWAAAMGITTIAHPFEQMGTVCSDIICSLISNEKSQVKQAPARLVIEPMVIYRNSISVINQNERKRT